MKKHLRLFALLVAVFVTASTAWAQYGSYGSPEMLPLEPMRASAGPYTSPTVNYSASKYVIPTAGAAPSALQPAPTMEPLRSSEPSVVGQMLQEATPQYPPVSVSPCGQAGTGSFSGPIEMGGSCGPNGCGSQGVYGGTSYGGTSYGGTSYGGTSYGGQGSYVVGPGGSIQPGGTIVYGDPGSCDGTAVYGGQSGFLKRGIFGKHGGQGGYGGFGEAACGGDSFGGGQVSPGFASRCYIQLGGLIMGRNKPNRLWTSYETVNAPNQLSTDATSSWAGGWEGRAGICFAGGKWGIEGAYWGLAPFEGFSSRSLVGGTVSTPLRVSEIEFDGDNGVNYFDNAAEHRVWRRNEVHNVELNLINNLSNYGCGPVRFGWSVGARFFRFDEDYRFGSVQDGFTWGEDAGIHEAYIQDRVENNLVGVQFGCDVEYQVASNFWFFIRPKVGLYNNHVKHSFDLYRGDGVIGSPTAISGETGTYPVNSTSDSVAMLGELDLGLDWQISSRWSAYLGYRVLFASGMALADNQIPHYIVDIPEIADVSTNGDLILHGAFAGVTFCF